MSFLLVSCSGDSTGTPETPQQNLAAQDLLNVSYGAHAQQKFDLYLPAGRSAATTKVFIFIHGGG